MSDNTNDNPYQLKLNYINYHMYGHMGFGANFGIQFGVPSISQDKISIDSK